MSMELRQTIRQRFANTRIDFNKVTLEDAVALLRMVTLRLHFYENDEIHHKWYHQLAVLRYPELRLGERNELRIGVDIVDPRRWDGPGDFHKTDETAIRINWDRPTSIPHEHGREYFELVVGGFADSNQYPPYARGFLDWMDYLEAKQGVLPETPSNSTQEEQR